MTDTDLTSQLDELRQQVAALSAARASASEAAKEEATASAEEREPETKHHQPLEQIEELIHALEKELRDNPVASGMAIFAAGVLVGRLLR